MTEVQCLICERGRARCIDSTKNMYCCNSCSNIFFTERKSTNNFQTKLTYFSNLLKRLSFNCNQYMIPKQKGNIFYIFYTQNNGIGLSETGRNNILKIYTKYMVFLQKNNVTKFTSSAKLLLYYIISLGITSKKFEIQTKQKLPLWNKFLKNITYT